MSPEYAFATMKLKTVCRNAELNKTKKSVVKGQIDLILDFADTYKDNKEVKLLAKNVRSVISNNDLNQKEMVNGVFTMITATNLALYC
jgi:hypothetical protein